jgi:hypothetical protein
MTTEKKLKLQNITWKATLLCGRELWTIRNSDTQQIEVIRAKILRPFLERKTLDPLSFSYIPKRVNV